ncbi:ATP-grasp fold, succinyl-CoA synthetase-type domain protein, partial [mine drainage metagenome]
KRDLLAGVVLFGENPPLYAFGQDFKSSKMNLHEYQAKALFRKYGIPVPAGRPASTPEEAVAAAEALGGAVWVV